MGRAGRFTGWDPSWDNDLLGTWLRVHELQRTRVAPFDVPLTDVELRSITGKARVDFARALAQRLADVSPTLLRRCANVGAIFLCKPADSQRNASANGTAMGTANGTDTRPDLVLTPPEPKSRKRPPARATRPAVKSNAPESLTAEDRAKLERWAQEKYPWATPHLDRMVETCLGHFAANGKPMANWLAVCMQWIRRERFGPQGPFPGRASNRAQPLRVWTRGGGDGAGEPVRIERTTRIDLWKDGVDDQPRG